MLSQKKKELIWFGILYFGLASGTTVYIAGSDAVLGLLMGSLVVWLNFIILNYAIRKLSGKYKIIGVQFLVFRYLLYLFSAALCVKIDRNMIVMYGIGILGLFVTLSIVYGIGGMKR